MTSQGLAEDSLGLDLAFHSLARASQHLAWAFLGLAQAFLGLAQAFQGLALASQGLAWTSQGLDLIFQGLAQASGGDGRTEFLPILQDFVPYRDRCSKSGNLDQFVFSLYRLN